jgi:hypothetical protein
MDRSNERKEVTPNHLETPGHGAQGIDKAPGEETATDKVNFKEETQQGKKVDGDPSSESDKPVRQVNSE